MALIPRIDKDHRRFREIVRGRIRENLRKYVSRGDMIARKGKDRVTIPMPQIDIPRFIHGDNNGQGVGQGEGEPGDPVGDGEGERPVLLPWPPIPPPFPPSWAQTERTM